MARLTQKFTATVGRDKGKVFLLTEMAPRRGHAWAMRLMLAVASSGIEIPEDVAERGLAGLASMAGDLLSALGKVHPEIALPLGDELLDCVQSVQEQATRAMIESDIEEVVTLFHLQKAVFMLHTQPFISGGLLTSGSSEQTPAPTA